MQFTFLDRIRQNIPLWSKVCKWVRYLALFGVAALQAICMIRWGNVWTWMHVGTCLLLYFFIGMPLYIIYRHSIVHYVSSLAEAT